MTVSRSWVHGNALLVEDPSQYTSVLHHGWGTDLTFAGLRDGEDPYDFPNNYRVCHIPVPTPSARHGLVLETIFLLFNATNAGIVRIDLWDGPKLAYSFTPPSDASPGPGGEYGLYGDLRAIGRWNTFHLPSGITIESGLGVSMLWTVNPSADATVTFAAAGADFVVATQVTERSGAVGAVTRRGK